MPPCLPQLCDVSSLTGGRGRGRRLPKNKNHHHHHHSLQKAPAACLLKFLRHSANIPLPIRLFLDPNLCPPFTTATSTSSLKENKFSRKADLENREKKKPTATRNRRSKREREREREREGERERMWRWRGCIDGTKTNGCRYSRS